jgi:hypothetical protein
MVGAITALKALVVDSIVAMVMAHTVVQYAVVQFVAVDIMAAADITLAVGTAADTGKIIGRRE